MLVFKDTILGFVTSVQLSVNDLLRPGDWIEVPGQKADGIVRDINITTVKIQNWDNTYSTVPTYSLLSNSFTNWRGMEESEGRRVKRSINIDMKSVKFYNGELIDNISKNTILSEVFDVKKIVNENSDVLKNTSLTNIGILRAYLESYLKTIPAIHPKMTLLIHYLQPNEYGLPLEIIFFTREKDVYSFEKLQCELFDHLLAVIPEFELRIFQL
jgi:miniconductance mechanosensitive channel